MAARRGERPPIIYNLKVENRATGDTLGYLVDITMHGIRLISDRRASPPQKLALRLHLPSIAMDREPVDLEGDLKWCRGDAEGTYALGVELREVAEVAEPVVRELIQRFAEHHDDSPDDPYLRQLDPRDLES